MSQYVVMRGHSTDLRCRSTPQFNRKKMLAINIFIIIVVILSPNVQKQEQEISSVTWIQSQG
jgi:hypothetical protein